MTPYHLQSKPSISPLSIGIMENLLRKDSAKMEVRDNTLWKLCGRFFVS